MMKKPEPISKHIVCSACGLPWDAHKARLKAKTAMPTLEDCVALLKSELAKRPLHYFNSTSATPNIVWGIGSSQGAA